MLHGSNLYMWAENGHQKAPELINHDGNGKPGNPASNLVYISDR